MRQLFTAVFEPGFFASPQVHVAASIGAVVAVVSAVTGVFTVMRGQSFAGHALGDVSAAGGSGALLLGLTPLPGFVGLGIVGAGVMDMIGNVYEWTSTKAKYYEGSSLTVEGEQRSWYVVRGASFATDQTPKPISATRRDWFSPTTKVSVLGFRLIRSV